MESSKVQFCIWFLSLDLVHRIHPSCVLLYWFSRFLCECQVMYPLCCWWAFGSCPDFGTESSAPVDILITPVHLVVHTRLRSC